MKFLADMGVDVRVARWLREQGHDAIHLSEEGPHRLSDEKVFAKAENEKRIILTFDLDFGEIVAFSHGKVVSVILFRIQNAGAVQLIQRLTSLLPSTGDFLNSGAVIVVRNPAIVFDPSPCKKSGTATIFAP